MRPAITPQHLTALFLPLVLALAGCPRPRVDLGKDGEPTGGEDLLKRIGFVEAQVFSLKGEGRLVVDSPQGKGAVTVFAAVSHPSLIHLEQLDFFGRPQSVFVTDGQQFGLYNAQDGKYFRGPASSANLSRFLPVVMPPSELASVMLGRAPRLPQPSLAMRFDDATQRFVLTLTRGEAKQVLDVSPPSYRVVKSHPENLTAYDLTFADLAEVQPGLVFPKQVVLDVSVAKTTLDLTWKDITLNEAPDLSMFELEAPEGVPVVEVDERGVPRQPPAQ